MKVVLAGAYGHLGSDILKELLKQGHEVVAADMIERDLGIKEKFTFRKLDVTDPEALRGLCDGADVVISTVGLTRASKTLTNMQIDYQGNVNLLAEARRANVKTFDYISVHTADEAPRDVPIIYSKYLFEEELKKSGINYNIIRPTGYFYDIINVFRPMIEKGQASLLGDGSIRANVIATEDLAEFVVAHMLDEKKIYDIGGTEDYSYKEMAEMCFAAAGKNAKIKYYKPWVFDMLAFFMKLARNGREPIVKFSKWTLTHDMVGSTRYGSHSFKKYVTESFGK